MTPIMALAIAVAALLLIGWAVDRDETSTELRRPRQVRRKGR